MFCDSLPNAFSIFFVGVRNKRFVVKQRDRVSAAWRALLNDVRESNAQEAQVALCHFAKGVMDGCYLHLKRICLRRKKKIR